ncbi:hypothetical protein GCM10018962_26170 [Dactylosporangium matsuzakiense]|uniref:Uncharacterized protein n=1 Tax=Dactylosporangium matsuzakiense TaxID=53360 RepID=A0A9W6KVZ1_9ACTN|nr:hypothetical protein GCM10017581_099350 [Dactylosporangium matsuzakiense]
MIVSALTAATAGRGDRQPGKRSPSAHKQARAVATATPGAKRTAAAAAASSAAAGAAPTGTRGHAPSGSPEFKLKPAMIPARIKTAAVVQQRPRGDTPPAGPSLAPNAPIFIACGSGGWFLFTPDCMWLDTSDVELVPPEEPLDCRDVRWVRKLALSREGFPAADRQVVHGGPTVPLGVGPGRGERQARSWSRGTSGSASLAGSTVVPL